MGKRARNLSLTPEAIARGEAYSAARGTTLSAVVEQFLRGLPVPGDAEDDALDPAARRQREIEYIRTRTTSPVVRELAGLLAESNIGEEASANCTGSTSGARTAVDDRTCYQPARRAHRVREVPVTPSLVLFDANVIFDLLLFRVSWCDDAIVLFEAVDGGR